MLRGAGVAGLAALAGCSGGQGTSTEDGDTPTADGSDGSSGDGSSGDGGDTSTDSSNSGGEALDNTYTLPTQQDPTNWQFNPFNTTQPFHHPMMSDLMIQYHIGRKERIEYAVTVEERTARSLTLKVRDGLTWHNGDPVTGRDIEAKIKLMEMTGGNMASYLDTVSTTGEKTAKIEFSKAVNQDVINFTIADPEGRRLNTPWRIFKSYIQDYREAGSDDARSSVVSDLRSATFGEDQAYGNGPFKYKDRNSRRLRLERFDDHPDADSINWDYYEIKRVSGDVTAALRGMELDGVRNHTVDQNIVESMPDALQHALVPALWGQTLAFNHEDPVYGKREVRQAIAYAVDRRAVATNYGFTGAGVVKPSGLVGSVSRTGEQSGAWKDWIPSATAEQLESYDDPNNEKAAQKMRDAGYEKQDGKWRKSDGSVIEAPIKIPANATSWHPIFQTVVGQLNNFGLNASLETIEDSTYWPDHYLAGNHRLATTGWTLGNPLPYFVFDFWHNIDGKRFMNVPRTYEIPPFDDPDGSPTEFTPNDVLSQLEGSQSESDIQSYRSQLAWAMNQYLPMLPMVEITDLVWNTTDEWEVPPPDSDKHQMKWSQWWLPRQGDLTAKTK